jgi:hypothetical protein
MNEFLLLAIAIVYLAICYGAPITKIGEDRQRPADHLAGKK